MAWQRITISRFGGPNVLELAEEEAIPHPGPGDVRIKVLAAGTGFTDTFIRRGRYPDYKGPLPFTPGYDLVGIVEETGAGVDASLVGTLVADLCVVGGYTQYAIRPARFLARVPSGVDTAEAVCAPLAYLTAYQMLTRYRPLKPGATILVIGASGSVGTALLDLARHFGLTTIGTCSAKNVPAVERFGATAVDYHVGDFVATLHRLTAERPNGPGVDAVFDAIGGAHFARSFACLAPGGLLVGYGSQTMAVGGENLLAAGLGLGRIKLWNALPFLFGGRRAAFYNITSRRTARPDEFKKDLSTVLELLRDEAIHPVVVARLPLSAARHVHERIDAGGLGGKIVLLPWEASASAGAPAPMGQTTKRPAASSIGFIGYSGTMTQAQTLARALAPLAKSPQFSYTKARAAARQDGNVDWPRTKALNADFNAEVDGCETFVMLDGSLCEWVPGRFTYVARGGV